MSRTVNASELRSPNQLRGGISLLPVIYQTPSNEESNIVSNSDLSRRDFVALMGAGAALTGLPVVARAQSSQSLYAYVGSWTQGPFGSGGGGGIGVFSVDTRDGSLAAVSRTGPEFDNMHAGYLCLSPDGRFLYANNEVKDINDDNGDGSGTGGRDVFCYRSRRRLSDLPEYAIIIGCLSRVQHDRHNRQYRPGEQPRFQRRCGSGC